MLAVIAEDDAEPKPGSTDFEDDEAFKTKNHPRPPPSSPSITNVSDDEYDAGASPNLLALLSGVVFGRSVRSSCATLHVARLRTAAEKPAAAKAGAVVAADPDDDDVVVIRLEFIAHATSLRSYCRRFCKLGDSLRVVAPDDSVFVGPGGEHNTKGKERCSNNSTIEWQRPSDSIETDWQAPCLVVHVDSPEAASDTVQVVQRHYWSMPECQQWQRDYLPVTVPCVVNPNNKVLETDKRRECDPYCCSELEGKAPPIWMDQPLAHNHHVDSSSSNCLHSGGLGKRTQGQYVASFLLHMIAQQLRCEAPCNESTSSLLNDPSQWAQQYDKIVATEPTSTLPSSHPPQLPQQLLQKAQDFLNRNGRGVLDVAGGSGHVSMALSLLGVRSTVVDPCETVGRLPLRDRKLYHHHPAIQNRPQPSQHQGISTEEGLMEESGEVNYCRPAGCFSIIPFGVLRAWFGPPPDGVDTSFGHPADLEAVEAIVVDDATLAQCCSALVALHPDEATDALVDAAVRWRIPFVMVPCCVLFRLFSHRQKHNGDPVRTYEDLLEYLMAKDKTIQRSTLPFQGANTILWSSFDEDTAVS